MIVCKCSRWHCAIMDMRSLVTAMDDESLAQCFSFVGVDMVQTEEHKNKRTHRKAERLFKRA